MKINELIQSFEVWTSIEERALMAKLKEPRKLSSLSEHDQFKVQGLIRKSLVIKSGFEDPTVVTNEKK
jgi:hypothetical protein